MLLKLVHPTIHLNKNVQWELVNKIILFLIHGSLDTLLLTQFQYGLVMTILIQQEVA